MLPRDRLETQRKRVGLINLSTDQAILWLAEANSIRQLRLGQLHATTDIDQQAILITHRTRPAQLRRFANGSNRRRETRPRLIGALAGAYKRASLAAVKMSRIWCRETDSNMPSPSSGSVLANPALSDLKICHCGNVDQRRALVKAKLCEI